MKLIGDPHLGRVFKNNVPLDRRGEREVMMQNQFWDEIHGIDDLVVIVGDLFDHWHIPFETVQWTIATLQNWADLHPKKVMVILQGNHDYSPSKGVYGAFDILELAMRGLDNVHVVRTPQTHCGVMFFPWEWTRTAQEQLDDIDVWTDTAVGHWDLVDYGGDTSHLCPAGGLAAQGVTNIISGHWHISGTYTVDGVDVTCTGSMQPMTHAEDKEGKLYVTLTEAEYLASDPASFKDKYVRVTCDKGSEIDPPATCLGFKTHLSNEEPEAVERVSLGAFDIDKIVDKHLVAHRVPKDIQREIKERLSGIA